MRLARLSSILMAASCFMAAPCFGGTVYQISVNASSLPPGTNGFIDFALNGGFPATATISNFSNSGGSLNAGSIFLQNASGALPGTVTLSSNNSDYDEGITYGTPIRFLLAFSATPGGTTGDVFNFSLFDTNFDGLLTQDVTDGEIVQFQLDTNGNITPDALPNPSGGASFATITAVPEPATWLFGALSPLVLVFLRRGKSDRAGTASTY
jgi:hypothetical protein